ncbi:MAG: sugar transferase, partial [Halobacteriales archaeon]|nr:sugar transferase [Halobacteriales archaeon]
MVEQAREPAGYQHSGGRRAEFSSPYEVVKRVLDVALATIGLVLAIPLAAALAIAIRLESSGPVFFRQVRVGLDGELFRIVKFRTMHWPPTPDVHRDHVVRIAGSGREERPVLRLDDDPRITRVGRFMRKWSLDELPNLWNVLIGEMSIVGPRPIVPYEVEALDRTALRRLEAKPGVTGLAQVNGRLDLSIHQRSDLDLAYVQSRSLKTDLL